MGLEKRPEFTPSTPMPAPDSTLAIILACVAAALFTGRRVSRTAGFFGRSLLSLVTAGLLAVAAFLTIGQNPWIIDARIRTYRMFYWNLGKDMTRAEVQAALEKAYPSGSERLRPILVEESASRVGFFMNPENHVHPDREAIYLKMDGGRVISKEYQPDR